MHSDLQEKSDQVKVAILLHGLGQAPFMLWTMASYLRENGYLVDNIHYKTRKNSLETHKKTLRECFNKHSNAGRIDLVGHSMGGIVIRETLRDVKPDNLGRVVMLGTPNKGSQIADLFENNFFYQKFFGVIGRELTTQFQEKSTANLSIEYDLGIIAGTCCWTHPWFMSSIPGPHDGLVQTERTKLEGARDYIELYATHTFMAWNRSVQKQTIHFLQNGFFEKNPKNHQKNSRFPDIDIS